MNSFYSFVYGLFSLLILCLSIAAVKLGGMRELIEFFKTPPGKRVLSGIVLFIAFGVISASVFAQPSGKWFAYTDVYLGIDNTNHQSPQCWDGAISDRLTSNGGVVVNVYRTYDHRFHVNGKYTHHSCVFNQDRQSYDSLGIELRYRLTGR